MEPRLIQVEKELRHTRAALEEKNKAFTNVNAQLKAQQDELALLKIELTAEKGKNKKAEGVIENLKEKLVELEKNVQKKKKSTQKELDV